jgi:nicotinamidase-related amidase
MPNTLLVVIDPQRAFVDPEGSLMRTCGADEVRLLAGGVRVLGACEAMV